MVGAPNLAVGNALGACVVNLAFLVVVDLLQRRQPMYGRASPTHLLSAGFGVVMLGFVAMSLLTGPAAPHFLGVGLYSPVLMGLYLLALRSVFAHEQAQRPDTVHAQVGALEQASRETVRRAVELEPDSVTIYQMELPYNTVISREMIERGLDSPIADWPTKRRWLDYAFGEFEARGYRIASHDLNE